MHTLSLLIGIALGIFVMGAIAYVVSLIGKKSKETSDKFQDVFRTIRGLEDLLTRNKEELGSYVSKEIEQVQAAISREYDDRNAAMDVVYRDIDSRLDKHVNQLHQQ